MADQVDSINALTPITGRDFLGEENLHADIYPAIDPSSNTSLHQPGKVVLITGAGRGCGRAMALQYAHAGVASINLVARTVMQLDEVEAEIGKISSTIRVHKFAVDVTKEDEVTKCAEAVTKEEARLDVLINNAGTIDNCVPLADSKPSEWWWTQEVNLKGVYLFTHAFLPLMTATAEKNKTVVDIISVSSIGAHLHTPGFSSYQISKLALLRLTEFIDLEYGAKGVNAVAIHPGGVATELAKPLKVLEGLLTDTAELSGGFVVWLTKGQRTWLAGRYLDVGWDVEKLEGMKDEIVKGDKLKVKMVV